MARQFDREIRGHARKILESFLGNLHIWLVDYYNFREIGSGFLATALRIFSNGPPDPPPGSSSQFCQWKICFREDNRGADVVDKLATKIAQSF